MTLIERIETAKVGIRELDAEILASLGTHILEKRERDQKAWWYAIGGNRYERLDPNPHSHRGWAVPRYTTSIDAALTLAEGSGYSINVDRGQCQVLIFHNGKGGSGGITPATPALAIVAAAMRARETMETNQ